MDRPTERQKGEYLDMDEDKRKQLDEQAAEYVDDAPALPSTNADPGARGAGPTADDPAGPDAADRVEA